MRFNYILLTLFLSLSVFAQTGTYLKPPALIEGFTTTASSAGTLTLTRASQTKQIITGVTTHTVVMPDATTMTTELGRRFFIINKSSGTVTVNASGGGLLGTILGGAQAEVHLRAAGSAAGTWDLLSSSAGGGGTWGSITGTLSAQTDLQSALDLKAPLASPTFTGTITTPLTASRALVSGVSNELAVSAVTATQLGYLGTATSDLQVQLDTKQARSTLTTAGDIYVATASATTTRLGPPALDGRQLVSDSAATNKIRYQAPMVDNFIKNGDAESVTPITTYADAAGTRPVDGTGGSPNVTTAISSSSPMFDVNSFTLVKDAANRQGQGWAIPFTIPAGQQAKVLQIEVPYIVSSGTFVAGTATTDSDVIWYIFDVTNSTLIEPSSIKLLSTSTTISDRFIANFQTSATGTSYRLIAHVATTSASAYTLKIDDIQVKPSQYVYGTPITDWVSYTPTFTGFGTVTNIAFKWRRVGSDIQIFGGATAGTVTTGGAITMPTGMVIASGVGTASRKLGYWTTNSTTSSNQKNFNVIGSSTTGNNVNLATEEYSAALSPLNATDINLLIANSLNMSFYWSVQIEGWSSSIQMSDSYDGRSIVFVGSQTSEAVTALTTDITFASSKDSVAGWSTNTYTARTPGDYLVSVSGVSSGVGAFAVYKNSTIIGFTASCYTSGAASGGSVMIPNVVAGDIIKVRFTTSVTITSAQLSIHKLQAPTTISATELIAAGYSLSANKTPGASAAIDFDSKLYDTHNAVTTGGSGVWKFTAPASGIYEVNMTGALTSGAQTVDLYKNGVQGKVLMSVSTSVTSGSASVSLVAGDYISANPDGSVTFASTKNTNIYIKRLK